MTVNVTYEFSPNTKIRSAEANQNNNDIWGADMSAFTPTITGGGVAGVGTYTFQYGYYTKFCGLCYFYANIRLTAHTGSGDPKLSLPVAVRAGINGSIGIDLGYIFGIEYDAGYQLFAATGAGLSYANLYVARDNLAPGTAELSTWAYPGGYSEIEYHGTYPI